MASATAQSTSFTYQGRLNDGSGAATGLYNLQFALFDAITAGTQQGSTTTSNGVPITNGLFTVTLDFGDQFPGANRWLEIGVVTNGGGSFTKLVPRQLLTTTPYAVRSANAIAAMTATTASIANSVAASNISGTVPFAQLPMNLLTNTPVFYQQQSNFTVGGVYTFTVPPYVTNMTAKLWGAGGGGGLNGTGGGGGFSSVTLSVVSGEQYTIVVGGHGVYAGGGGGGGSNDGEGGSSAWTGSGFGSGGGGQASSLFKFSGGKYIMKAVAGGGGGAAVSVYGGSGGGGYGEAANSGTYAGLGGANGIGGAGGGGAPSGGNYSFIATNTGEAALNLMGGRGGNGQNWSGGGGGGYGGGGGGGGGASYPYGAGGGGGGSYGTILVPGVGRSALPGNTADSDYLAPAGQGGYQADGSDGQVVLTLTGYPNSIAGPILITNPANQFAGDGSGLTNLNASNLASGKISDARLSTNVALLNAANVFTGTNTFTRSNAFAGDISVNGAIYGSAPYLKFAEVTTGTTQGGDAFAGTNNWRNFNVKQQDTFNIGSTNGAGDIILPAGTYQCRISAPGYEIYSHQIRLVTATGIQLLYGTTAYTGAGAYGNNRSEIDGQITLAGSTTLRVQQWCQSSNGGNGLGAFSGGVDIWGDTTNINIFATAEFWKIK